MHVSTVYININIHLTYLHTLPYQLSTSAKQHQSVFGPLLQTPYVNIVITYVHLPFYNTSIYQNRLKFKAKTTLLATLYTYLATVPLNYNFIFPHVEKRGNTTRVRQISLSVHVDLVSCSVK